MTDKQYPDLPEPLEIHWPELHSEALGCGVEDRNLTDRYEAAEYGWQDGVDKAIDRVPEQIFDADQMRAYADATCAMRAAQPYDHGPMAAQPVVSLQAAHDAVTIELLNDKVTHLQAQLGAAQAAQPSNGYQNALDIRTANGWSLTGKTVPVLYTDTINGEQVGRDDVWLCTTDALATKPVEPAVSQGEPSWLSRLRAEQGELAARYTKLHDFRQSAAFRMLHGTDQGLMDRQENQMHALLQTLNQRINGASVRHLRSMSHD